MLPFNNEKGGDDSTVWPMALPNGQRTPEYEAVWKEAGRQIREHFDRDPRWHGVMKIAFLDGLDESYNEASYEKMLYYGKLLHDAMGSGWFKYRVDGGYSRPVMECLSKEVELWVCHTEDFDISDVDYFRAKGVNTWFYGPMIYEQKKNGGCGSNTFLDLDLLVNRGIGWVGWKYRTGWVEWEFDWNAFAAWYEAENYKDSPDRIYNGSGQLIYRGAVMQYQQPIPEYPAESAAQRIAGLRIFLAAGQENRWESSGGRFREQHRVQAAVREERDARHRNLEKQPGGVGPDPDCGRRTARPVSKLLVLVAVCALAATAADLRLGIIGTDTSHVTAFTKILNDSSSPQHVPGARVVAAFKGGSKDLPDSYKRVDKFAESFDRNGTWNLCRTFRHYAQR